MSREPDQAPEKNEGSGDLKCWSVEGIKVETSNKVFKGAGEIWDHLELRTNDSIFRVDRQLKDML